MFNLFNKEKVLFISPHQDDELLSLGVNAANYIEKKGNKNVYVLLITNGAKSNVRKTLHNQKSCKLHNGIHNYDLSRDEFIKARDREFTDSCLNIGYRKENICFPKARFEDNEVGSNVYYTPRVLHLII